MIQAREELTAREREQNDHEKEMFVLQAEHTQKVKAMELEVARIDTQWSAWLRIPLTIVRLPFLIVMGIAYCISVARKFEVSEEFWRLIK